MASELSLNDILQGKIFMGQLRIHALVLAQIPFHFLHALQVRSLHATVPGFPVVVSGITDTVAAANVLHLGTGISLFQDRYDRCLSTKLSCPLIMRL